MNKKHKLTAVGIFHYFRLIYRSAIFVCAAILYIIQRFFNGNELANEFENRPVFLIGMWCVFVVEMVLRFFPSKLESPGCQKQFKQNYIKTGKTSYKIQDNNGTMLVALIWIIFNGIFGCLHMTGILDDGFMLVLCSAYSVCDMICILFFCPFQSWILKNKCCCTCRIYNWDYAMMFTPLFFVRNWYSWSLLILSVALLLRWEITFYMYPERFAEETNGYLTCSNCSEKLCHHKTQLHSLWQTISEQAKSKIESLKN